MLNSVADPDGATAADDVLALDDPTLDEPGFADTALADTGDRRALLREIVFRALI